MGFFRRADHAQTLPREFERLLVIDVETTGVNNSDRIVEVAAVTLSPEGKILDEWDTLVNPERDVGPTYIHGVTASMVSAAPVFEEVAAALAARVQGAVLVAHNLAFDSRMLANEYSRLSANLDPGRGVCTLRECGQRLTDACARYGIGLEHHHRALADARATAQLLHAARCKVDGSRPATLDGLSSAACPRTLRRDVLCDTLTEMPYLARLAALSNHRGERGAALVYLDMLDWALDDLILTAEEWAELSALASGLGMADEDVRRAHEYYMRELIAAAARDNRITDQEYRLLERVSEALRLDEGSLEEAVRLYRGTTALIQIDADMTVCFTGAATYSDGTELPRASLTQIAESLNLRVVEAVTKKGCDLLVAADPSSQSGKAGKARQYGIPIVDVRDFLCAHRGAAIPGC